MINFDIKSIFYTALGFIVMAFLAVFKYRGARIDSLKEEVENHEAKDLKQDFEKDNSVAAAIAEAEATDYEEVKNGKIIL